jgi:hypothetical protein
LEAEVCTYYLFFDLLLSWQSFVKYKNRNSSYRSGIVFLIFFCNHLKKSIQAYASYMKGTLLFEQEKNIEAAMMNFKNTRFVKWCPFHLSFGPLEHGHYSMCRCSHYCCALLSDISWYLVSLISIVA